VKAFCQEAVLIRQLRVIVVPLVAWKQWAVLMLVALLY